MAIATPESYADMLDRAKAGKYAIPAINVTSSQTLSAALKGFADAESDGIVQISNGGAAYWSGSSRLDRVKGSIAFTAYARAVGDLYPVTIGLHTDHCPKKLLADWIHPLLEIEAEQVKNGELPMFNSHMWDGSAEALDDNIEIAVDMLKRAKAANVVLEIEIGAVGGEEDGIKGEENANLYTTADDAWKAIEALGLATSSCARRSSARSRRTWPSASVTACLPRSATRTRPSTWSCTVAPAPPTRRSPPRCATASSR